MAGHGEAHIAQATHVRRLRELLGCVTAVAARGVDLSGLEEAVAP